MSTPWELRGRGLKDSMRHDKRVKEALKKNLKELIAEEAIITSDGKKKIKIPLRFLEQYRFKYGHPQQGTGQGPGNPGDIVGRRGDKDGQGSNHLPGDKPGEHSYEVEVPIEELVQMMLEDLALPWLEEKPQKRMVRSKSYEFKDIRSKGAWANLEKRRTAKKNIIRRAIQEGKARFGKLKDTDLQFKVWDENEKLESGAAVYMLMDVSGSMTTAKKYIAKSFFFWVVRFLRLKYKNVDTFFIAHDTEAEFKSEKEFFHISEGGGTTCSSSYKKALEHIIAHRPASSWNNYLFHFSDGDNLPSDNPQCKELVEKLLGLCQMVGYGEIRYMDDASFYGWLGGSESGPSSLQKEFARIDNPRFISVTIKEKSDLYQTLQEFLKTREPVSA